MTYNYEIHLVKIKSNEQDKILTYFFESKDYDIEKNADEGELTYINQMLDIAEKEILEGKTSSQNLVMDQIREKYGLCDYLDKQSKIDFWRNLVLYIFFGL
ncbi:hypothetical protein [Aquiflexum gelatinilyticum]|uniref:Uncharacterized protein n=1 Tax=Aquiflexum gelatinilyticum TaxID=2961943 RepID=A0A9X2P2K2_9BACT|nr:hypothetical protein [Aquiflexum gelatinilyticum]MCR9014441.1 hypothetical protein [Aquiflexum gelatinilyticum]